MKMAGAWLPARATLPQVHEAQLHVAPHDVWAQAPLTLRLPQVPAEVEAQSPLAQEHEAEARAPLEQAHEAEAQALLAQAPSRQQAHPRVKVPLEVLLAQAPCWAAVPLAIHLAHVQRL